MKEKKKLSLLLGVLLVAVVITVGASYALWQITLQQESTNVITTGCFKLEFEDKDNITLSNAYPMSDADGKALTPYEFTITNTCENISNYVINLETISSGEKILEDKYVKASLKKGEDEVFFDSLGINYLNEEKGIEESTSAYKLYQGKLENNESITFTLNLWMDESTPTLDSVMNALYESKIVVISSYVPPVNTKNMMVPMQYEDEGTIARSVKNLTYSKGDTYIINKLVFQDEMNPIEDAVEVEDFSLAQDRSVLGYYVELESVSNSYARGGDIGKSTHDLIIQANGKIKANFDASYYGSDCHSIEGLENLDTSLVTDMSYMFATGGGSRARLTELDLRSFDTSNVENMSEMFSGQRFSELDLSSFDTRKVTSMRFMFDDCTSLTNLDVRSFDTSNVTDMRLMFGSLSNLTSLDLSSFDTSNVDNMFGMFKDSKKLTNITYGDNFIRKIDSDVTNMFYNCPANRPLNESWNGAFE